MPRDESPVDVEEIMRNEKKPTIIPTCMPGCRRRCPPSECDCRKPAPMPRGNPYSNPNSRTGEWSVPHMETLRLAWEEGALSGKLSGLKSAERIVARLGRASILAEEPLLKAIKSALRRAEKPKR